MFDRPLSKRAGMVGLVVLLLVLVFEVTLSIRQQSLSWDEDDHLYAGYMSLTQRDFGMNPEHPPLVKALAALPLLPMHLQAPAFTGKGYFKGEAFMNGREFLFRNGGEPVASKMIFRARLASGLLTLLLGVLVFLAGREMFGTGAALIGLALMVFEPNMVAHGAYVATDMGVACFMFATMYALYRYVKAPGWGRLVTLGIAAGLTLATKHSGVLILPMALTLLLTEVVWPQGGEKADRKKIALRLAGGFVLSSLIAVVVLWAFYGFRFSARPGGVPLNPTYADYVQQLKGFEPGLFTALARWHVLPESYLYGMIDVRGMSIGFPTYIFGQVHAHGVWYYFPVAFVIKSTAAFLILLGDYGVRDCGGQAAGAERDSLYGGAGGDLLHHRDGHGVEYWRAACAADVCVSLRVDWRGGGCAVEGESQVGVRGGAAAGVAHGVDDAGLSRLHCVLK